GPGGSLPYVYGFLDNEWLQAIVNGGITGVAAMIVLAVGGIFGISALLRGASTPRERDQAYGVGSIFIAILSTSFTFDLFSYQQATLIYFISFGLLWSNFKIKLPEVGNGSVRSASAGPLPAVSPGTPKSTFAVSSVHPLHTRSVRRSLRPD